MQPAIVRQAWPEQLDLLNLYRANPARYPFLLQSVARGPLGRYDILFAFPQDTLTLTEEGVPDFFKRAFLQRWEKRPQLSPEADIPFLGGFFAFFAYEYARVVEPTLQLPRGQGPLAQLVHCPAAIIVDHATASLLLVAEPGAEDLIEPMQVDIKAALQQRASGSAPLSVRKLMEEPPAQFLEGVETIRDYIFAGDVFQVNLSRAWQAEVEGAPADLYDRLRRANPAPFAALADFGDWQVISSSPERLLRFDGTWLETRPIAGTRKRGATPDADARLKAELLETVKERAEHIMLIDLERNDLGRICQPGTVEVNELMVLESYQHVHHIVSNVRGRPRDGLSPLQQIEALFPGGTITGCPKVRCMEIIAELEAAPRQAYTGSLGYISWDGRMDLNILIRTLERHGSRVHFRAGAGIVADAQAEQELKETRHKAEGLLRALG
ncbi:anthranilate synthase component 1 [Sulfurivirga caldicuralii]|uniref:Anthranilate synthase component 1 n=1 Tax=Sulfurivirga caldicuralii TaxID=364032 RepID=A0A1N6EN43_9GAMM|nr:aminodeoxychorismate synthase component I [Sulfurivirga caldicuralii]SIN84397.1 anthranilate synthase component 1 [Sulfurivirga caldicuralii]